MDLYSWVLPEFIPWHFGVQVFAAQFVQLLIIFGEIWHPQGFIFIVLFGPFAEFGVFDQGQISWQHHQITFNENALKMYDFARNFSYPLCFQIVGGHSIFGLCASFWESISLQTSIYNTLYWGWIRHTSKDPKIRYGQCGIFPQNEHLIIKQDSINSSLIN